MIGGGASSYALSSFLNPMKWLPTEVRFSCLYSVYLASEAPPKMLLKKVLIRVRFLGFASTAVEPVVKTTSGMCL